MPVRAAVLALLIFVLAACSSAVEGDVYEVTLASGARDRPATGRIILFFITESDLNWDRTAPAEGPFWDPPQPIASIAVDGLEPGATVRIEGSADGGVIAFPGRLDELHGRVRVQAVLDVDQTERSHAAGPGNLLSDVVEVDLDRARGDTVRLMLSEPIVTPALPERDNLKWITLRSERLSRFYGRDVFHRAGVALPVAPVDDADDGPTSTWPTVYVIPSLGERHESAWFFARMLSTHGIDDIAPRAVHVVLDPESPLGHHGFVDSPNHGPRGTALVEELIPHLEREFGLDRSAAARIVTGTATGGWSAVWLALQRPEVFGACWASAPTPLDFRAFRTTNLYEDTSLYDDAEGQARPAYRRIVSVEGDTAPILTVREECLMEVAVDPEGRSGQSWDACEAMFSPPLARREHDDGNIFLPQPMFNWSSGDIDRVVIDHWSRFDVSKLVAGDWGRYGPIVTGRIRIACGTLDSFYLDRSTLLFKTRVEALATAHGGWSGSGYIRMVDGATHANLQRHIFTDWNREMREHLDRHAAAD